ncbi:MAG: hypothetical protein KAG18_07335 [Sinobacterium sp.]|nr:hypothetical protein [Sinobacterium sp.]
MHNHVVYLAVDNRQEKSSDRSQVIETLGKFNHVSEAIASFNSRYNTFDHALMAYQSNHEKTAVTRLYHIDADRLATPTMH